MEPLTRRTPLAEDVSSGGAALDIDDTGPLDAGAAPPRGPSVVLKGSGRGLEILIDGEGSAEAIGDALATLLAEAPGFFAGSDARVRVANKLPAGALARLEQVTARFALTIVEVGPKLVSSPPALEPDADAVPQPGLADGSAPLGPDDADGAAPKDDHDPASHDAAAALPGRVVTPAVAWARPADVEDLALAGEKPAGGPRLVLGPVRSGAILEHHGHLVILGDVNPGAEVRAAGNILVLGRLRGVAHAAVGGEVGFILALRFEPQQLRIGRLVARAADADGPGEHAELAYVTGKTIVVERYQGRLPSGLAASL